MGLTKPQRAALDQWLISSGWAPAQAELEPLAGQGRYCRNYQVVVAGQTYLAQWRLPDPRQLVGGVAQIVACQQQAWRAGVAPEPVYVCPDVGLLISRWVVAGTLGVPPSTEQIVRLGEAMARLHRFSASGRELDLTSHLQGYYRLLGECQQKQLANCHRRQLAAVARWDDGQRVLCHHDLHGGNILWGLDGSVCFCDWEYAAMGLPWFDLAMAAESLQLDNVQQIRLLDSYQAAGGGTPASTYSHQGADIAEAAMTALRQVCGYCNLLWYLSVEQTIGLEPAERLRVDRLWRRLALSQCAAVQL